MRDRKAARGSIQHLARSVIAIVGIDQKVAYPDHMMIGQPLQQEWSFIFNTCDRADVHNMCFALLSLVISQTRTRIYIEFDLD